MGFFSNKVNQEVLEAKKEVEKIKIANRLEKGRLKADTTKKESKINSLESKIKLLQEELKNEKEQKEFYENIEINQVKLKQEEKQLEADKEDFEYDKQILERKKNRLEQEAEALSEEKNVCYKSGYSDGLADGLRKAHDITREDRKYLTMIAMATNSSEAIKQSHLALGESHGADTKSE